MKKNSIVFKFGKNARVSFKDDGKVTVFGELLNAEEVGDKCLEIDGVDEIADSHFSRVVFRRTEKEKETNNISVSSAYTVEVGIRTKDGIKKFDAEDVENIDLYRGEMMVKCSVKVIEHTERGKKYKFLVAYPQVIVIPEDWEDHLFDPFEGM